MCFGNIRMEQRVAFWAFFVIVSIAKLCHGKVEKTIEISSLLAESVNNFIEKLQNEQSSSAITKDFPQTRGGYGHGGGGNGHGAITLDPVSIISLLALGAFLINNILQLLRANMGANTMGRSLSESALENLSLLSVNINGIHPSVDEPGFADFFKNIGSLYYLQPKKRHMCMKRVVCDYINIKQSREKTQTDLKTKIFDFMLSTVTKIVAPEMDQQDKDERCLKAHKFCGDSLLQDARISIEYKIYSQVSTWITKLAFNGLASG